LPQVASRAYSGQDQSYAVYRGEQGDLWDYFCRRQQSQSLTADLRLPLRFASEKQPTTIPNWSVKVGQKSLLRQW
jgi:hypothetical protein